LANPIGSDKFLSAKGRNCKSAKERMNERKEEREKERKLSFN
jgi:hypothetical protein